MNQQNRKMDPIFFWREKKDILTKDSKIVQFLQVFTFIT